MSAIIAPLNPSTGVSDPLTIGTVIATSTIRNAGVEQIVSATKPTTRVGGSALVADDLWYDTAANRTYFWNGTFWLSQDLYYSVSVINTPSGASFIQATAPSGLPTGSTGDNTPIFLQAFSYACNFTGSLDGSNYYNLRAYVVRANNTNVEVTGTPIVNLLSVPSNGRSVANLALPSYTNVPAISFAAFFTRVGTGTTLSNAAITFEYRHIAP